MPGAGQGPQVPPQPANFKDQSQGITDVARVFNRFAKNDAITPNFVYTDNDQTASRCSTRCSTPAASDKQGYLLESVRS